MTQRSSSNERQDTDKASSQTQHASASEKDVDATAGSAASREQVELQNDITHMLIGMPEMARALVRGAGPCVVCRGEDHPSLRCGLLSDRNLPPEAHARLQEAKARVEDIAKQPAVSKSSSRDGTVDIETGSSCSTLEGSEDDPEEAIIRKKLSKRAYHLPGNSWCQDFLMYITNNHLLFGIFCHHRLHPVKVKQRVAILLGSVAFGLILTNFTYLYYLLGGGEIIERTVLSFSIGGGGDVGETTSMNVLKIDISQGMAMLWTVGAASHSLFDFLLWHMIACGCVRRGCCRVVGWKAAMSVVMLLVALTSFVVLARAYDDVVSLYRSKDSENAQTTLVLKDGGGDFGFMYGYLIELGLSLFVFGPLTQICFFSGILGCGMLPFLGGRPYEVGKCKNNEAKEEGDTMPEASVSVS